MKYGLLLKIILLILSISCIGLIIIGMYSIVFVQNSKLNWRMLIPVLVIVFGFLGVVYQIKTYKYYTNNKGNCKVEGKIFWIANGVFAAALCVISLFAFYSYYEIYGETIMAMNSDTLEFVFIFTGLLALGIALSIEESVLYKRLITLASLSDKETIDDIKGEQNENV